MTPLVSLFDACFLTTVSQSSHNNELPLDSYVGLKKKKKRCDLACNHSSPNTCHAFYILGDRSFLKSHEAELKVMCDRD